MEATLISATKINYSLIFSHLSRIVDEMSSYGYGIKDISGQIFSTAPNTFKQNPDNAEKFVTAYLED